MKHGQPQHDIPLDVFLSDDPDLALVEADMDAWAAAHGCRGYNGTCDCDKDEDCDLARTEQTTCEVCGKPCPPHRTRCAKHLLNHQQKGTQ